MRKFPLFKRMGTVLATLTVGCAGSLARPRSKWEDTCQSESWECHTGLAVGPGTIQTAGAGPLHIHYELYKMRLYMS